MSLIKKAMAKNAKPELTSEELEFLLKLIADSQFDGKDVQRVYTTAVKLQKMLTE